MRFTAFRSNLASLLADGHDDAYGAAFQDVVVVEMKGKHIRREENSGSCG